jgi:hypothetical protein
VSKKARLRYGLAVKDTSDLFPSNTFFFVEPGKLTDSGNYPLPRAFGRPDRFDQGPVVVALTIYLLVVPTELHAEEIIRNPPATARGFSALHSVSRKQELVSFGF